MEKNAQEKKKKNPFRWLKQKTKTDTVAHKRSESLVKFQLDFFAYQRLLEKLLINYETKKKKKICDVTCKAL